MNKLGLVNKLFSIVYRYHPVLRKGYGLRRSITALSHIEVGALGEKVAAVYLKSLGFKILYSNYRGPKGGELDLVAREGESLVFIEVKTRRKKGKGRPLDAVNLEKQALIERGAQAWLKLLGRRDMVWRFDVVEVILEEGKYPDLTLVREAF